MRLGPPQRPRRVVDLLNPAAMLLPAANVIMQLSAPGVGHGVLESPVESGNVYKHPFKRARTTGTYLAAATFGTDADRALIRANKPGLIAYLSKPAPTLPAIRPDVLALVGLTDQEIGAMSARLAGLRRAGYSMDDAEQIADRLLMRDRTGLDMAACVECKRFTGRRCIAGEPVGMAHELRRCPAFRTVE